MHHLDGSTNYVRLPVSPTPSGVCCLQPQSLQQFVHTYAIFGPDPNAVDCNVHRGSIRGDAAPMWELLPA
jgi:hypothetical protein